MMIKKTKKFYYLFIAHYLSSSCCCCYDLCSTEPSFPPVEPVQDDDPFLLRQSDFDYQLHFTKQDFANSQLPIADLSQIQVGETQSIFTISSPLPFEIKVTRLSDDSYDVVADESSRPESCQEIQYSVAKNMSFVKIDRGIAKLRHFLYRINKRIANFDKNIQQNEFYLCKYDINPKISAYFLIKAISSDTYVSAGVNLREYLETNFHVDSIPKLQEASKRRRVKFNDRPEIKII